MRLEADGLEPLTLSDDTDGDLVVSEYELTFPEVRAVTESRPGADGETDRSAFFGARALTLKVRVHPDNRQALMDRLRAFCHPATRPWFYWDEGGGERRIQVRADTQTAPISSPSGLDLGASFRCPSPFAESADPVVVHVRPPHAAGNGLSFPFSFPISFAGTDGSLVDATNAGNMPAQWVARIFGACTDPQFINTTTGETIGFDGLTLSATDYVEINSTTHTVLLNGTAGASRYHLLDISSLSWWVLNPGSNLLQFAVSSSDASAVVEVTYRATWL